MSIFIQFVFSIYILSWSFANTKMYFRCEKVLAPKGIDIVKVITEPDTTIFDSVINSFVGIAAVQIGFTDILKELGIEPDYIIGEIFRAFPFDPYLLFAKRRFLVFTFTLY